MTYDDFKKLPKETQQKALSCIDCERVAGGYMVTGEVWSQAFERDRDEHQRLRKQRGHVLLCLWCLEKRIGRPLERRDFSGAALNDGVMYGYEMGLRRIQ